MFASGRARAVVALTLGSLAAPAVAHAQACCAGVGLVIPARLRIYEGVAAGTQLRARTVLGSFDASGSYHGGASGDVDGEQDLFAAVRLFGHAQAAVLVPFLLTRRSVPGLTEWGSGVGDVSLRGRYDIWVAGESARPGLSLLLGLSVPTGRPVDQAHSVLATDATGAGTWDGTVGVSVEQVWGRTFASVDVGVGQRTPRSSQGVRQGVGPHATALLAGGRVFGNDVSAGAFLTGAWQGAAHDRTTGQTLPGSATSLLSAGAALVVPVADGWRAQGTVYLNGAVSGLGRNQLAGVGTTLSILRAWL